MAGRVCSEMTSCEEATFFLQNCPGVKMDGEGDGVPCERQWCGHRLTAPRSVSATIGAMKIRVSWPSPLLLPLAASADETFRCGKWIVSRT